MNDMYVIQANRIITNADGSFLTSQLPTFLLSIGTFAIRDAKDAVKIARRLLGEYNEGALPENVTFTISAERL